MRLNWRIIRKQVKDKQVQTYLTTLCTNVVVIAQAGVNFSTYEDGYERHDVVKEREAFINTISAMESEHKPPPACPDGVPRYPVSNEHADKSLVLIYHDETISAAMRAEKQVGIKRESGHFCQKIRAGA